MAEAIRVCKCFYCGADLGLPPGNAGRSATCPQCSSDVRVCYNCQHYNSSSYNECNEPNAERVLEKNRSNFCDYFHLAGAEQTRAAQTKDDALKKLDQLFKR